jgi:hypothetical protein
MTVELLADLITKVIQHEKLETRIVVHENTRYIQEGIVDKVTDLDLKIRSVLDLIERELLTPHGSCRMRNISKLESLGYKVTKDKPNVFGDSPIVIHTTLGCIAYG